MNINKEDFISLICKNINEKKENINLNTKIKDLKKWDSLTNIRIVIALQTKTKKSFNMSKFYNFKSLNELFIKINQIK